MRVDLSPLVRLRTGFLVSVEELALLYLGLAVFVVQIFAGFTELFVQVPVLLGVVDAVALALLASKIVDVATCVVLRVAALQETAAEKDLLFVCFFAQDVRDAGDVLVRFNVAVALPAFGLADSVVFALAFSCEVFAIKSFLPGLGLPGVVDFLEQGSNRLHFLVLDLPLESVSDEVVVVGSIFSVFASSSHLVGVGQDPRLLFLEIVEVGCVSQILEFWNVDGSLLSDFLPANPGEERMGFDFLDPVDSESLVRVSDESSQQVGGFWAQVGFLGDEESVLPVHDLFASG